MTWRIEPTGKNCIHERREFAGDHDVAMIIYWRYGHIVVDELPDLKSHDPDDGIEISSFDDWQFRDGSTELEIGEDTPAEERQKIEQTFAEDGEDGLEALGYDTLDTTYLFLGKLKVTDLTPELIENVKGDIAGMESIDDLQNVVGRISNQSGFTDDLKSELSAEALRAGLEFGADLFSFEDFCELVSASSEDSTLKYEALQLIRNNAEDAHDLANAAMAAVDQLDDPSLAAEILDEALERAEANWERIRLVQVALGILQDSDRAKKALIGFEEEANSFDCRVIAEAIAENTENRDWAMDWYVKSLELVKDWEDQYRLIGSIDIYLDDPILVKNAYERYDYLKAAGFNSEHPYWDSNGVDHLILMNPNGLVAIDSEGLHVVEEQALHDAEFWQWKAKTLAFLLPGQYTGPIKADVWRLSVIGLGSPENIVISGGAENTISVESGELHLHDLTIVREDSEDAENFAAILAAGDATLLVRDCILKSPGGFAFAAVGEEPPRTEIINCQVVDSANGIYGGAGRTTIDNVTYRDVEGFEASDGGDGLLELIEERHRDLAALVENEQFFNLYGFDEEWVDPDDFAGYRSQEGGDIFERVYYACALKEDMPEEMREFFVNYLPEDFEQRMFPKSLGFHAFLGIYNVRTNQLVGIGLGKKDRTFKKASHDDLDWDDFCDLDRANLAEALYHRVEEAGRLHGEYLATSDKEEEAELKEEMDEEWRILRDAVPTLPEDISEVSGISGHLGHGDMEDGSTPEISAGSFDTLLSFEASSTCTDEDALDSILDEFRQEHEQLVDEFDGFRLRLRIDGQGIDSACSSVHERMATADPGVSVRAMWDDGETIGVTVTTLGSTRSRSMDLSDAAQQFMNERRLEGDPDDVDDMSRIEQEGLWDYIYELRDGWIAEIEGEIRAESELSGSGDQSDGDSSGESAASYLKRWLPAGLPEVVPLVPDYIAAICDIELPREAAEVAAIVANIRDQRVIPILAFAPAELLYQTDKRLFWVVPGAAFAGRFFSWIAVSKNGIYAANPEDADEGIMICSWDAAGASIFEKVASGRFNLHFQSEEGTLTLTEFCAEGEGSLLEVIKAIHDVYSPVIEASRGLNMWRHGAGEERYVGFDSPSDLLNPALWRAEEDSDSPEAEADGTSDTHDEGTPDPLQNRVQAICYLFVIIGLADGELTEPEQHNIMSTLLFWSQDNRIELSPSDLMTAVEVYNDLETPEARLALRDRVIEWLREVESQKWRYEILARMDDLIKADGFVDIREIEAVAGIARAWHCEYNLPRLGPTDDADEAGPEDDDEELEDDDIVIPGEVAVEDDDRVKEDLFIAPDAPQRFLDFANLLHDEGGKRRRKVRSIFKWFGFQRRGVRAISFVTEQFDLAKLEVVPTWEDSAIDDFVEVSLPDSVSPGGYRVLRAELEDDSKPLMQVRVSPSDPKLIEVPTTIADEYVATMAKVLSSGDVVVCSVREVLSWFGVSRRGKRVVDRVMDAFEKTHVTTTPSFDEAPIDGHVTIRLQEGAKAGEFRVQRPD